MLNTPEKININDYINILSNIFLTNINDIYIDTDEYNIKINNNKYSYNIYRDYLQNNYYVSIKTKYYNYNISKCNLDIYETYSSCLKKRNILDKKISSISNYITQISKIFYKKYYYKYKKNLGFYYYDYIQHKIFKKNNYVLFKYCKEDHDKCAFYKKTIYTYLFNYIYLYNNFYEKPISKYSIIIIKNYKILNYLFI